MHVHSPSQRSLSSQRSRLSRLCVFLLLGAYWVLPGHYEPLAFAGASVGPASLSMLAALWLCCFALPWRQSAGGRLLATVAAFALAASATGNLYHAFVGAPADGRGLLATYYDNAEFAPPAEPSIPKHPVAPTRIEPAIDFGAQGFSFSSQYFSLPFANDTARRQWTPGASDETDSYPFSVVLRGFLTVPADARELWLEASGGSATLRVDEAVLAAGVRHPVAAGVRGVEVRYARNAASEPGLVLHWTRGDRSEAVPAAAFDHGLDVHPVPKRLDAVALALWSAAFLGLLLGVRPRLETNARVAAWTLFAALLLYYARDLTREGRGFGFQIFAVGNDWLEYESLARAIRAGNWLSAEGSLVFLNFGYRYVLAALHFLAGEAAANAMLLQRAVMALAIAFAVHATWRLYGSGAAWALAAIIVFSKHFRAYAEPLLDTTFAIALCFALLYCLIRYARDHTRGWVIAAALALGIGVLVRANFLPLLALAAGWMYFAAVAAGPRRRIEDIGLLVAIGLSIAALLGVRNYLVSGQWVFLPTNGLPNLWIGNHPPEFDGPTYFTAQLPPRHEIVERVFGYALAEPGALLRRMGEKALFILGLDQRGRWHGEILLPWLVAIVGSASLFRNRQLRPELYLLWGFVLLINLPLLVLFPWGYGWRLSAPGFLPLYIVDALALAYWGGILRRRYAARRRSVS